jgi:hypothetical protein
MNVGKEKALYSEVGLVNRWAAWVAGACSYLNIKLRNDTIEALDAL